MREEAVCSLLPAFDGEACTGCKECVRFCRFHALLYIADKPMVFAEMCQLRRLQDGVPGACRHRDRKARRQAGGRRRRRRFRGDRRARHRRGLRHSVIRDALGHAGGLTVIDCPPRQRLLGDGKRRRRRLLHSRGGADGVRVPQLQDGSRAREPHGEKCGVVVNKQDGPFPPLDAYCEEAGVEVLARIPYDAGVAASVADGRVAAKEDERVRAWVRGRPRKVEAAL